MKHRVRLSARAERDAEEVLRWLAEQGAAKAADRWFALLWSKLDTLETLPLRCRLSPEAAEVGMDVRELLFGRRRGTYRILFVVEGNQVDVLHIRHAARDAVSVDEL